jgi:hypothetical protein
MILGTLAGAAALVFATVAPAAAQPVSDPPGFDRALAAKQANIDGLLAIEGVVGAGIGLGADGSAVIVVTTAARGVAGVPRRLDGVAVVIKVTGPLFANAPPDCTSGSSHPSCKDGGDGGGEDVDPTLRFDRPVPIGVSTGNTGSCSAGTIGARVTDGDKVFALSNNHVYALENGAAIGSQILQPGKYDTNCDGSGNAIGTLYDFEPITFSTSASNVVDAAIALTNEGSLGNGTPADGYGVPGSTTVAAELDPPVQKYGRTTGHTCGVVVIIGWTGNIGYSSGSARFVGQIVVESIKGPFLKSGDSGSLLVTDDGNNSPVGLLFAGTRSGKYGIANPIDAVLSALVGGVTIDGN